MYAKLSVFILVTKMYCSYIVLEGGSKALYYMCKYGAITIFSRYIHIYLIQWHNHAKMGLDSYKSIATLKQNGYMYMYIIINY